MLSCLSPPFADCDIGDDFMRSLGDAVAVDATMQSLNLSSNPITTVPDSFLAATNLSSLDMSECRELVALPHQLYLLTGLTELDLRETPKLTQIPDALKKKPESWRPDAEEISAAKRETARLVLDFLTSATESIRRANVVGESSS